VWLWYWRHGAVDFYASLLSADERHRLHRFGSPQRQRQFICGRGGLRLLLSHYSERSPQELELAYSLSGKPILANSPWHFNLSHTDNLILCAIAAGVSVGIDVEYGLRSCSMEPILRRWAEQESYRAWQKLSPRQQQSEFWRWWTQKEAIAKAVGTGIWARQTLDIPHQTATFTLFTHYIVSVCAVSPNFPNFLG